MQRTKIVDEPPQPMDNRPMLPLFDVASGRVLDRLFLALSGHARAFGGRFRAVLLRNPADPVRPPASFGLGRARDEVVERRGVVVAGPILIFAAAGGLTTPAIWPEPASRKVFGPAR